MLNKIVALSVRHRFAVRRIAERLPGHRVVEDEARAADQVPGMRVVDRAVVLEELEEAAGRIDAARMVEGHRVAHVPQQELARTEVGQGGSGSVHAGALA